MVMLFQHDIHIPIPLIVPRINNFAPECESK